jgi:hypothetical protein
VKRAATLYVFLALLVWGLFAFDRGAGPRLLARLLPDSGAPDAMLAP